MGWRGRRVVPAASSKALTQVTTMVSDVSNFRPSLGEVTSKLTDTRKQLIASTAKVPFVADYNQARFFETIFKLTGSATFHAPVVVRSMLVTAISMGSWYLWHKYSGSISSDLQLDGGVLLEPLYVLVGFLLAFRVSVRELPPIRRDRFPRTDLADS